MTEKQTPVQILLAGATERRAADRVPYEVAAELRHGDSTIAGRTENVSASGAFFSVPNVLPVGSKLHLRFDLPNGAFEADGTIMRIRAQAQGGERGAGIGVMFHDIAAESRARLEKFCPAVIVRDGPG